MKLVVIVCFPMDPESSFERTLEDNNQNIRSVCKLCGAVIVSSVEHGIAILETIHLKGCKKPNQSIHLVRSNKSNQSK
jgi:hypothetical protein